MSSPGGASPYSQNENGGSSLSGQASSEGSPYASSAQQHPQHGCPQQQVPPHPQASNPQTPNPQAWGHGQQAFQPGQPYPQQHSFQPGQPGQPGQHYAQHPHQPAQTGNRKTGNRKTGVVIGLGVLAVLLIAGLIAAIVLVGGSSGEPKENTDGESAEAGDSLDAIGKRIPSEPQKFTPEMADDNFTGHKMSGCDFGDEFYAKAGIEDVIALSTMCVGFMNTADGQVNVGVGITDGKDNVDQSRLPQVVSGEGLDGWDAWDSSTGETNHCTLVSTRPELENVMLLVFSRCELLYPLAVHINNLTDYHNQEKGGEQATYVDPAPWDKPSIAPKEFLELRDTAKPASVRIEAPAPLEGSSISLKNIEVKKPEGEFDGVTIQAPRFCADVELHVGPLPPGGKDAAPPTLTFRHPNGDRQKMELQPGDHAMKENSVLPLRYCVNREGQVRDTVLLLSVDDPKSAASAGAWKLTADKGGAVHKG